MIKKVLPIILSIFSITSYIAAFFASDQIVHFHHLELGALYLILAVLVVPKLIGDLK